MRPLARSSADSCPSSEISTSAWVASEGGSGAAGSGWRYDGGTRLAQSNALRVVSSGAVPTHPDKSAAHEIGINSRAGARSRFDGLCILLVNLDIDVIAGLSGDDDVGGVHFGLRLSRRHRRGSGLLFGVGELVDRALPSRGEIDRDAENDHRQDHSAD